MNNRKCEFRDNNSQLKTYYASEVFFIFSFQKLFNFFVQMQYPKGHSFANLPEPSFTSVAFFGNKYSYIE
jgi:hypothetical protein